MTEERVIEMIDEYLLEPNSIVNEWVEGLLICRTSLVERLIPFSETKKAKELWGKVWVYTKC